MHRNKKFEEEKNIMASRMPPLYAFHDVLALPCNAHRKHNAPLPRKGTACGQVSNAPSIDSKVQISDRSDQILYQKRQSRIRLLDKLSINGCRRKKNITHCIRAYLIESDCIRTALYIHIA